MNNIEEKIKIIDEITTKHPSYGVDKGWSEYTGGMKDSGGWFFREMLDVPADELKAFLGNIIAEENKPSPQYTDEEIKDMKIIHEYPNGYITEYGKKKMEAIFHKLESKFFLGK